MFITQLVGQPQVSMDKLLILLTFSKSFRINDLDIKKVVDKTFSVW